LGSRSLLVCRLAVLLGLPCSALPSTSVAAPVGNPLPDATGGHVALTGLLSSSRTGLVDEACVGIDGCDGSRTPVGLGGRAEFTILTGVAVFGEVEHVSERVDEAFYEGKGVEWGGGARLAIPVLRPFWVGVTGQFHVGSATGDISTVAADTQWQWARVTAAGIVTANDHGAFLYFGPTWRPVTIFESRGGPADFDLVAHQPFGGVFGGEVQSERLGPSWAAWNASLRAGGEITWEEGFGVGVWTGVAF
jgi:hypothetical protein